MRLGVDGRVLGHTPTGVSRYLSCLLERFSRLAGPSDAIEVYVDRPPRGDAPGGAGTVRVLGWKLPGGDPAWRQIRLASHLRRDPPDVLFCPFYTIPLAARVPSVVTIHDVSFLAHPEWFGARARLAFRLVGPSARRAARVVTVSRFSAGEIERHLGLPASRIEVIPNAVSPDWFADVDEASARAARAWLGHEGPYLLHLGAVHRRRNVDVLVRAFADLARSRSDLALVIGGPTVAPAPDLGAEIRDLGLEERVVRREWVPERHVRALVRGAAALVYLSSYEGFGLPALEAMAAGAPVLALRRASLPEVLGDAALWVDSCEPDAVARAAERVLGDSGAARDLARAGRERASRYTWDESARRTFEVLRRVADGGRGEG